MKERVATVEAPDARTVRFVIKKPWPDFLTFYSSATGAGWIVPKKYVEKVGDEGFKKAPIGAGPYKFVSFTPGVELVLEAFDGYWRKTPEVKRLVFRVIPEEATRLAALKRGEVDIAYSIRGELAEELQRTPGLTLKPVVIQAPFWLYFADQWDAKSPWHDQRVREAARLAIDYKAISDALTLGHSPITNSIIPNNFAFFWQPPPAVYDAAKAKKLLADAGHPNGFDAGDYYCDCSYSNVGEAVINYLQEAGIRVRCARSSAPPSSAPIAEEAEERHPGGLRRVRQCRHAPRGVRGEGRRLRLRQLSRHRRAVRQAGAPSSTWRSAPRCCTTPSS